MEEKRDRSQKRTFEGGRWGIVIILSAFMIQFLTFGTTASIGVYNIELLEYFNDAAVEVSLISSINFGVFLGAGPLVSYLMSRYSYRKIALCGSVLVTFGLLGMPLLPYLPAMMFSFGVLSGFGSCCVYIPSHVLSGLYYERYRSLATGVATSGSGLGGALMPVIVGSLIEMYSWKGSFIILAGLCLHLFVFSALLRSPPSQILKDKIVVTNENGELSEPVEGDLQQSTLLVTSFDDKNKFTSHAETGVLKEISDENQDFPHIDMSELDFIDKLSWRPGAGFVSTENILNKVEEANLKNIHTDIHFSRSDNESSSEGKEDNGSCKGQTQENGPPVSRDNDIESFKLKEQVDKNGISAQSPNEETLTAPKKYEHFYILTHYGFVVYFINNIFWNTGISILQSFAPEFLRQRGITPLGAAWVIGGFGFGCFVGGVLGGVVGNIKCINRIVLFIFANFFMGIFILLLPALSNVVAYSIALVLSGIAFGVVLGLLIVVLTDLVGIECLGNGLGYLMLSNGIGAFSGPPLAGLLYGVFGGFDSGIYLSGITCVMAGLVMLLIPLQSILKRKHTRRV